MVTVSQGFDRYDRPVDSRPASLAHGLRSKVIRSNISSRVQVCIELEPARLALEIALALSVRRRNAAAARTFLRRVPRIDITDRYADCQSLVGEKGLETTETPRMKPPSLPLPRLDTKPNICQIFQCDSGALRNGSDQLLGKHVVTIAAETCLPTRQRLEVSSRRARAFRLQGATESKSSLINLSPPSLSEKSGRTCNGGAANPKINANNLPCRINTGKRCGNNDMGPEPALPIPNKVGATHLPVNTISMVPWQRQVHVLTSLKRSKTQSASSQVNVRRPGVVSNSLEIRMGAANFSPLGPKRFCGGKGFRSLHPGRADKLRRQAGLLPLPMVGSVVQFDTIDPLRYPAHPTDPVKGLGVTPRRVGKSLGLLSRWVDSESKRKR